METRKYENKTCARSGEANENGKANACSIAESVAESPFFQSSRFTLPIHVTAVVLEIIINWKMTTTILLSITFGSIYALRPVAIRRMR